MSLELDLADTEPPPGRAPQMGGFVEDEPGTTYPSWRDLIAASATHTPEGARVAITEPGPYGDQVVLPRTPPIVQFEQDCVAVSGADAYLYELIVAGLIPDVVRLFVEPWTYEEWLPSRRKMYWDARACTGREHLNAGVSPAGLRLAVRDKGVCAERWCPYQGSPLENPLADHDEAGRMSMDQAGTIELADVDSLGAVRAAIDAGHRVLHAFLVYESLADVRAGGTYTPSGKALGGHQVQIVGYVPNTNLFLIKNQWPGFGNDTQEAYVDGDVLWETRLGSWMFARVARYSEQR